LGEDGNDQLPLAMLRSTEKQDVPVSFNVGERHWRKSASAGPRFVTTE
jgi:hypothetical protein